MIYLYYGENTQERDAAVKEILQAFIAVNGDMAVDVIETEDADISTIVDAITTIPFLAPKRLVVIRYLSASKDLSASIDTYLDRVADTTDILFIEARLDARSVYTKTLKKRATEVKHFESVEGPMLQDWLVHEVEKQGGNISGSTAQLLLDRVGSNQQLLHNEIKKLLLISSTITNELIVEMTHISPHSSVFAMLDAIMQGNVRDASKLYYEQRVQGMEPQAILGMIAWQLHILAIVVAAKDRPVDSIASKAKLNPFVVRKNLTIAKHVSKKQMIALLDAAILSDTRIKTGKSKADQEIHLLLLRLAEIVNTTSSK